MLASVPSLSLTHGAILSKANTHYQSRIASIRKSFMREARSKAPSLCVIT